MRAQLADVMTVEIDGNLPLVTLVQRLAASGFTLVTNPANGKLQLVDMATLNVLHVRQTKRARSMLRVVDAEAAQQ